jgi:hypothetical protein
VVALMVSTTQGTAQGSEVTSQPLPGLLVVAALGEGAQIAQSLGLASCANRYSAKGGETVKKRIVVLASCMALAASGVASAAINDGNGAGNPDTNGSGKCSPGQNKDTSPGGLKKCP